MRPARSRVAERQLTRAPVPLERAQPLVPELGSSEVENLRSARAAVLDRRPEDQLVAPQPPVRLQGRTELEGQSVRRTQKDRAGDRHLARIGQQQEATSRLNDPVPQQRVEAARLNRHAQPTPSLDLQGEKRLLEVGAALACANDDPLANRARDVPLHLRAAESVEDGVLVAVEIEDVSQRERRVDGVRDADVGADLEPLDARLDSRLLEAPDESGEGAPVSRERLDQVG